MKKSMRSLALIALCAVLSLSGMLLVGCGGASSTPQPNGASAEDTAVISPEADVLVAYFSPTGHTQTAAEYIYDSLTDLGVNADLYAIEPEEPYTEKDLDYNDPASRTSIESEDLSILPDSANDIGELTQYDVVMVGYPIWFGKAPNIMYSFLADHEMAGKIIIPFCTSKASGIGSSAKGLETVTAGAIWESGMRFPTDVPEDRVVTWVDSLVAEPAE